MPSKRCKVAKASLVSGDMANSGEEYNNCQSPAATTLQRSELQQPKRIQRSETRQLMPHSRALKRRRKVGVTIGLAVKSGLKGHRRGSRQQEEMSRLPVVIDSELPPGHRVQNCRISRSSEIATLHSCKTAQSSLEVRLEPNDDRNEWNGNSCSVVDGSWLKNIFTSNTVASVIDESSDTDKQDDTDSPNGNQEHLLQTALDGLMSDDCESDADVLTTYLSTAEEQCDAAEPQGTENVSRGDGFLCMEFADFAVIALNRGRHVAIRGRALVRALCGTAAVHGYELRAADPRWHRIFSPSTHSLLTLTAISSDTAATDDDLLLSFPHDERQKIESVSAKFDVVVLLKCLSCHVCDFVVGFIDHKQLFVAPSPATTDVGIGPAAGLGFCLPSINVSIVNAAASTNALVETEAFSCTADEFVRLTNGGKAVSVVVCGGLNSGKSTFCRYLINRALNHVSQLAYLECDIGQAEFTPAGCISLTLVSEPLLGPPFTHQRTPLSSVFIGQTSPAGCVERYLRGLRYVYNAYLRLATPRPPLVVNTMGWMKDDGLSLLVETLRFSRPSLVVQLFGNRQLNSKTIPLLTPEFLANAPPGMWLCSKQRKDDVLRKPHYRWIRLTSEIPDDRLRDSRSNAACRRDLAMLAYFGDAVRCQSPGVPTITSLRAVTPYRVCWSNVAVHVCHEPVSSSQILYALNGSLVALCVASANQLITSSVSLHNPKLLRQNAICECVGYGIVRSIDPVDKSFYILTPVAPYVLETVNCLCRGAINLPACVLSTAEPTACIEPYVDCLPKLPHIRRRRRKPPQQQQQHAAAAAGQDTSCSVVIVDTHIPDTSFRDDDQADAADCGWTTMDGSFVADYNDEDD